MNLDRRPAWTLEVSDIHDQGVTVVKVWIRQPPRGMLSEIEELLKKYIGE